MWWWRKKRQEHVVALDARMYHCCGVLPDITEYDENVVPHYVSKVIVRCGNCGEHITSKVSLESAMRIWNNRMSRK